MNKKEYTIKVILHEARDIKLGEITQNFENQNIYFEIETCGLIQYTKQQFSRNTATINETKIFERVFLSDQEFSSGEIKIRMMNKTSFYKFAEFIAEFACNITSIFKKSNRECRGQWITLNKPQKPKFSYGYLLVDFFVNGELDKINVQDETHEKQSFNSDTDEEQQVIQQNIGQMTLTAPIMERKPFLLTVNIYKGEYIIGTNAPQIDIVFNGKLQSTFNPGGQNPDWKQSFEFPFEIPTLSDKVLIKLVDPPKLGIGNSNVLASAHLDLNSLIQKPYPPGYINLYGNQDIGFFDKIQQKYQQKYQKSNQFMGRLLVSASAKSHLNPYLRRKPAPECAPPKESNYILWFDLYELVGFTNKLLEGELQIGWYIFKIGEAKISDQSNNKYKWPQSRGRLQPLKMSLPKDTDYIPDIFLNIYESNKDNLFAINNRIRIAYLRLLPKEVMQLGTTVKVKWYEMTNIQLDQQNNIQIQCLFSINFGFEQEFSDELQNEKPRPKRMSRKKSKFEIWCHIIQAKNLIFEKENSMNNFVSIVVNEKEKKTHVQSNIISPMWNQLIRFRTSYPQMLDLAHEIYIYVKNQNNWSDFVIGKASIHPINIPFAQSNNEPLPQAKWITLTNNGKYAGSLLVSFLLHRLKNLKQLLKPKLILPKYRRCLIKILLLGTRKIENYLLSKISSPSIEINLSQPYFDLNNEIYNKTQAVENENQKEKKKQKPQTLEKHANDQNFNATVEPYIYKTAIGFQVSSNSDANHNYLEQFDIPCMLPEDCNYSPSLDIKFYDSRQIIGKIVIGALTINLHKYLPWINEREKLKIDQEQNKLLNSQYEHKILSINQQITENENTLDGEFENNLQQQQKLDSIKKEILSPKKQSEQENAKEEQIYIQNNNKTTKNNFNQQKEKETLQEKILQQSNWEMLETIQLEPEQINNLKINQNLELPGAEILQQQYLNESSYLLANVEEEGVLNLERPELPSNYEDEMKLAKLDYEIYHILRMNKNKIISCGLLKLKICIIEQPLELIEHKDKQNQKNLNPLQFSEEQQNQINLLKIKEKQAQEAITELLEKFQESDQLIARLYLLNCSQLVPRNRFSDILNPYVWIKRNEEDIEYKYANTIFSHKTDPEINTTYPITIRLPDDAYLKIQLWDRGKLGDHLIGETEIDLENRWFHPQYQLILQTNYKNINVEKRTLYRNKTNDPQGAIRLWLELIDLQFAQNNPPEELQPLTYEKYEFRVVIWSVKGIPLKENGKVNIKVKCCMIDNDEGEIWHETDTHYNSKDGRGEFNWRMKFRIILPSEQPRLTIQVVNSEEKQQQDQTIGETIIDLQSVCQEVHKKKCKKNLPISDVLLQNLINYEQNSYINMEIWILPENEADLNPVGNGRQEPNQDPYLPLPEEGRDILDILPDFDLEENKLLKTFTLKKIFYFFLFIFLMIVIIYVSFIK